MKKNLLYIFVALAVFVGFFPGAVPTPVTATPVIINVPGDYSSIQAAIDAASPGSTVIVAAGNYTENLDFKGKAITVASASGAASTLINGGAAGSVVKFITGETAASVLDGFTLTNGAATYGGGIFISGANATISNSIITGNLASGTITYGGGIAISNASPTIINSVISGNQVSATGTGMGGGIWIGSTADLNFSTSNPKITKSTIRDNSSYSSGGGIAIQSAGATIDSSIISGNSAGGAGGGINISISSAPAGVRVNVSNTIIRNNGAGSWGGGIYASASTGYEPNVINATILANNAGLAGGGIDNSMMVANSIVWDNTAPTNPQVGRGPSGTGAMNVTYSNIKDGYAGTGNINTDPMFVNKAAFDLHLLPGSPSIDTGNNAAVPTWLTVDFDGNSRIADGNGDAVAVVDMGVDEVVVSMPPIVTTDNATNITGTSAQLNGNLTSLGSVPSAMVSFQWGLEPGVYMYTTPPESVNATGTFSFDLAGLSANTTYYFHAKAMGYGIVYGEEKSFVTSAPAPLIGKIAFTSNRDGNYEIYVMNPDGSNVARLTNNPGAADASPTWSPDGKQIAYVRGSDPAGSGDEIYVMNADGSNVRRLTNNSVRDSWLAWSPDGTKIAYESNEDVYVMNSDGSNPQRLTNYPAHSIPAWSPDGTKIAFLRDSQTWVMNADGSNQTAFLIGGDATYPLRWSPDGDKIAFSRSLSGAGWEVFVANADLSGQVNLTNNGVYDWYPSWSPNGSRIAFTSERDGNREIYVMNADGTNQTRLTDNGAFDAEPAWSPFLPAQQKPDLVISEKHEEWIQPGISYRVSFTIKNTGNVTAPAGHDTGLSIDGVLIEQKQVPVSLAPGTSYTDNFTSVINLSGGVDTVIIDADLNNEVDESSEGNRRVNSFAWPPAPDLVITDKHEQWIVQGQSYVVHFMVENRGNTVAMGGHEAALYVEGVELERKMIAAPLNPGTSYSGVFSTNATLSGGVDKVKVVADIANIIAESNETSNAYENTIAWPAAPDLIVNSKTERWIAGQEGRVYNVSFQVLNIGNANAPAGHDIQLWVDGSLIEMVTVPFELRPGDRYRGVFSANVTATGTSDNIMVTADANNEVVESDETNNSRTNTWSTVLKPDLTIVEKHAVWLPGQEGIQYTVSFTVKNQGNVPAAAGHDTALQVEGKYIEFKPVPVSLAPGASYSDNFTTVITLSGNYDGFTIIADYNNEVDESSETNNRSSSTVSWPPAPDLRVNNSVEEWVVAGSQYRVRFGVRNEGNALAPAGHEAALTIDGVEIERKGIGVSLANGQSYSDYFSTSVNLTGSMDKVRVTADIGNILLESREDNNNADNTIAWPQAPDLVVNSKYEQWLQDSTTQYNVYFGVQNIGNSAAAAGHDVELRVDGVVIGTMPVPLILNPGNTYNAIFSANLTLSGSSDNITVTADINNEVTESDETNNSRNNTWAAGPDLWVAESHEIWAVEGTQYFIAFTIRNNGNIPAPAGHDTALLVDGKLIEQKVVPVSIAPGATYTDNFTAPISLMSDGNDDIAVETDFNKEVHEPNEGDNRFGMTVAWPPAPNLNIGNKYEQWVEGQPGKYKVFFTVRNRGNAPAAAGHDTALVVDGIELERKTVPIPLPPNASYSDTFVTEVALSDGVDKVKVVADVANQVAESREDNNSRENTFSWPPAPDLLVNNKYEKWVDGQTGNQYSVYFEVRNIGNADTPAGHDVQLVVDGLVLETKEVPVTLGKWQSWTGNFSTNVTMSGSSDNITVIADANHEIAESDELNNSRSNTLSAPVLAPDLAVIDKHEEWLQTGSTYRVFFTVKNVGTVTVLSSGNSTFEVGLNVNGVPIEQVSAPGSLAPGAEWLGSFSANITLSQGGFDKVAVQADVNNEISEPNEGNNWRWNIISWPPKPNLTVNKWEEWQQPGGTYIVRYKVDNNGNAPAPAGHDIQLKIDGVIIETKPVPVMVNPAQSYTDVFSYTANLTGGVDSIAVTTDVNNEVVESVEGDNSMQNTLAWPAAPDLVIRGKMDRWVPGQEGNQYNVQYSVQNIGNGVALAGHDVQLQIDGIIIESGMIPVDLPPNQEYREWFTTNINLSGSSDNITVIADVYNEVAESDETNNSRSNVWPTVSGVQVIIKAPARVAPGRDFNAVVDISQVQSLDAASYNISFNPAVLRLDSVTNGNIAGIIVPVDGWNVLSPGNAVVVQNIPGLSGATGAGNLAILHFHVIGSLGQSSDIAFSSGVLSNIMAEGIPATWVDGMVEVSVIPGDANGDGVVNAIDITKVERIIAHLDTPTTGADANQDGFINSIDITKVERTIVGLN